MILDRLTTDNPQRIIEVLLNYAYAENGYVKLRSAGGEEGVDLCEYIEQQRRELDFGCGVDAQDVMDGACMLECDCPLAVFYVVAIQAAELRGKLKHYEDLEEQGRLFIKPFKEGETAYYADEDAGRVLMGYVASYEILFDGAVYIEFTNVESDIEWVSVQLTLAEAEKTVFLTREEAEEALRRADHEGTV